MTNQKNATKLRDLRFTLELDGIEMKAVRAALATSCLYHSADMADLFEKAAEHVKVCYNLETCEILELINREINVRVAAIELCEKISKRISELLTAAN